MHTLPPNKRITARFKDYNRDMKDVWSSFVFIDFYTETLAEKIKKDEVGTLQLESLSGKSKRTHVKSKLDTYGMCPRTGSGCKFTAHGTLGSTSANPARNSRC